MTITLDQARLQVQLGAKKGTVCPCCDRYVKTYRRVLNSGMAVGLIRLVRLFHERPRDDGNWWHGSEVRRAGCEFRDFDKLEAFGLVERRPHVKGRTKTSGFWRPTNLGTAFAYGRITVPKYVDLFNGVEVGRATDPVSIDGALRQKFNYQELMRDRLL